MNKFFADLNAGGNFEACIKEVKYEHFVDNSENTIMGYDGDICPKGLYRSQIKNIRYSLFFKNTLYDTFEEANDYLNNQLQKYLNEFESEFEKLKIKINNIKKALNNEK